VIAFGLAVGAQPSPAWPAQPGASAAPRAPSFDPVERALIEAQPVCIASSVWSAGELGDTVAYHYRRQDDRIDVGYFVFWSTERPWGPNALTLTVLPAAAIDAVYSHFLFVLPGLRDAMYGPGDVEGATVSYRILPDHRLAVLGGVAQDGVHDEVALSPEDLLDRTGRVILMSDVWSHQLGAKRAAARTVADERIEPRCFLKSTLARLAQSVISQFRLGTAAVPMRARAAWRPFRNTL
jgi:hypothetical protein